MSIKVERESRLLYVNALLCSIDYLRFPYYYCEVVIISNSVQVQLLFVFWGVSFGGGWWGGIQGTLLRPRGKRDQWDVTLEMAVRGL